MYVYIAYIVLHTKMAQNTKKHVETSCYLLRHMEEFYKQGWFKFDMSQRLPVFYLNDLIKQHILLTGHHDEKGASINGTITCFIGLISGGDKKGNFQSHSGQSRIT